MVSQLQFYDVFYSSQIETDTQQMRQTLADIEAQHADIMKLEKSIMEVHALFMDMASMIESQGDKIDSIENHVSGARDYIERAKEEMKEARKYDVAARKVSLVSLFRTMHDHQRMYSFSFLEKVNFVRHYCCYHHRYPPGGHHTFDLMIGTGSKDRNLQHKCYSRICCRRIVTRSLPARNNFKPLSCMSHLESLQIRFYLNRQILEKITKSDQQSLRRMILMVPLDLTGNKRKESK